MSKVPLKKHLKSQIKALDKRITEHIAALEAKFDTAYISQSAYNQGHDSLSRKMEDLIKDFVKRREFEIMLTGLTGDVKDLRESRRAQEGKSVGVGVGWTIVLGGIGVIGLIVALILNAVRLFGG